MSAQLKACPAERQEIALALLEQLNRENEQWVAVRLRDGTLWEVVRPSSQGAILGALDTSLEDAVLRAIDSCGGAPDPANPEWSRGYDEALATATREVARLFARGAA